MNEQWNNALDQVEDEFLLEAVRYRRRRYWPGVAAAAAAVLVLAVGWSVLHPKTPPMVDPSTGSSSVTEPPGDSGYPPPGDPLRGEDLYGIKGDPTEPPPEEETPVIKTLHYDSYEDFRTACLQQQERFLHPQVAVPVLNGQPLEIESITVFETEMYNQPWVWYFISHVPHITVRIPTDPALTANLDPDASGGEALRQIWPDAPNLHNREEFTGSYSEIRELEITTSEGVKKALLRQEADRDRVYLTFLQEGTLVTVAGPEDEIVKNWLEAFSLTVIEELPSR